MPSILWTKLNVKLGRLGGYYLIKNPLVKKSLYIILTIAALVFVVHYFSVFLPILLAFLTALALDPLVKILEKRIKKQGRLIATIIAFISYLVLLLGSIYLLVAKILQQLIKFLYQLPHYISDVVELNDYLVDEINLLIIDIPQKHLIIQEIDKQGQMLINKASIFAQDLIPLIASWIQGLPGMIVVFIVYLITTFLFTLDLSNIKQKFYGLFPEETAEKVAYIFHRLGVALAGFAKAQILVSFVIFFVSYIGLLIISPERALLMAIIIWIIDVIPFIGSIIIIGPWIIYTLIIGNGVMAAKLTVLQIILLAIRRILEPKILGEHAGIAVLPTLLSMYFAIYFLGPAGLILGPMVYVALKAAIDARIFTFDVDEISESETVRQSNKKTKKADKTAQVSPIDKAMAEMSKTKEQFTKK